MIIEYFNRLSPKIQYRIQSVENAIGFNIDIDVDPSRKQQRNGKPSALASLVSASSASIILPSVDYFPEESVFHELLHIERFLVTGVPQLQASDHHWSPQLEDGLTNLDNMLEHILIVPEEIHEYPSRCQYWVTIIADQLQELLLTQLTEVEKIVLGGTSWAFVQYSLSNQELSNQFRSELSKAKLEIQAESLAKQLIAHINNKEAMAKICIRCLGLNKGQVCLSYLPQDLVQSLEDS